MAAEILRLSGLAPEAVPADLRAETYFDFAAHPFAHRRLFDETPSVCAAILGIRRYAVAWLARALEQRHGQAKPAPQSRLRRWNAGPGVRVLVEEGGQCGPAAIIAGDAKRTGTLYVCRGARVAGATVWLDGGDVLVGEESVVEPGAGVKGPTIIGCRTEIRQGAYLRGDCILGDDAVIRGEIKNSVFMDRAAFPHPSYQGDSLCGYASHFGAGANTANVAIFSDVGEEDRRRTIVVRCGGRSYDTGMRKMGVCMGDFSQVGCNSVSDPATFLKPRTVAYPLTRLSKGFYGPDEILKNKPLEHGVIERAPLLARR